LWFGEYEKPRYPQENTVCPDGQVEPATHVRPAGFNEQESLHGAPVSRRLRVICDMILATAHALPHDTARQSFAVGMVHASFYGRIALPWPAVEQFIVRHTEAFTCSGITQDAQPLP
jgi:hypothetical protein